MKKILSFLIPVLGVLAAIGAAAAKDYTPDIIELDGTRSLTFSPAPQLILADGGTIEFWVAPDWHRDPGYDPVIFCNAGPKGPSYLIAMLRDRDGLAFAAGSAEDVVSFNFMDGKMHHVAISQLQDGMVVFVDGRIVGTSAVKAQNLPSVGVWLGSIDGRNNRFRGAIAGLRIWDAVIEQKDLVRYALRDIFDGDHPDLDRLSAISDFANGELLLVK